jgi:hypothetical protein
MACTALRAANKRGSSWLGNLTHIFFCVPLAPLAARPSPACWVPNSSATWLAAGVAYRDHPGRADRRHHLGQTLLAVLDGATTAPVQLDDGGGLKMEVGFLSTA